MNGRDGKDEDAEAKAKGFFIGEVVPLSRFLRYFSADSACLEEHVSTFSATEEADCLAFVCTESPNLGEAATLVDVFEDADVEVDEVDGVAYGEYSDLASSPGAVLTGSRGAWLAVEL